MRKASANRQNLRSAARGHQSRTTRWLLLAAGCILISSAAALTLNAAPGKAKAAAQTSKTSSSTSQSAANGRRDFKKFGCYECHGLEAQGSPTTGPRLGPDPIPLEVLIQYVRKPAGQMPAYTEKVISDQQLADIYAFLKSLPQPPPVKSIPQLQ